MVKKNIALYSVLVIVMFAIGFFSGGFGPGRKVDIMGSENQKLTGEIEDYRNQIEELSGDRQRLNSKIGSLTNQIERLNDFISGITEISAGIEVGLIGIYDEIGDSRQRIQEASEGLNGVSKEIRQIIDESETKEPDNNR